MGHLYRNRVCSDQSRAREEAVTVGVTEGFCRVSVRNIWSCLRRTPVTNRCHSAHIRCKLAPQRMGAPAPLGLGDCPRE